MSMCVRVGVSTLLTILILAVPSLQAQSEQGTGVIDGYVLDPSGAAIAGARIVLQGAETGYLRQTVTNNAGRFSAAALPTGRYTVTVESPGFSRQVHNDLALAVGRAESLLFRLQVEGVAQTVEVTAGSAILAASEASPATLISTAMIGELPIRSRNFAEFVQLAPAVVQEQDRLGLVISGQRSINSNVAIDGADFNDALQGNQRGGNESVFFFPQSAIREFQVVRAGVSAEVGRTSAGFVNAVTQSGTNAFHGDVFYFNRNRHLTSKDAFGRSLDNRQNQFGGSIGGPLARDRAFFYLAAEQNILRVPFVVEFENQAGLPPELLARQGEFHGSNNPTAVFGRVDLHLNPAHTLNVHYSYSRLKGENFNFDSPRQTQSVENNYTRRTSSNAIKMSLTSVLGSAIVNELKFQYATDFRLEDPNTTHPAFNITGVGSLGGDAGRPRQFDAQRYQVANNISWVAGKHDLRMGVDLNVTPARQKRESNITARWDFTSLANYLAGRPNRYRQTLALDPDELLYEATQQELAFFISDRIAVGRRLTVNAGLRWEGQWNPDPVKPNPEVAYTRTIPNDLGMWQPRLGLTWDMTGEGSTVLSLSAGIFAARTPANLFQRVFTDNGLTSQAVDFRAAALQSAEPPIVFPNAFTSLSEVPTAGIVLAPRVFGFDPDFRNPRTFQTSAALQRRFGRNTSVSVEFLHLASWDLQRRLNRNLFPPQIDETGMAVFPSERPQPEWGILSINESSARSNYQGLVLAVNHRFGNGLEFMTNYTLSRTRDDDSNERNFSQEPALNPFDLKAEQAYSKQDVRHNLKLSGFYRLPGGFTASAILFARSGLPYTAVLGADVQNDGNEENDRAIIDGRVVGRNTFRQPGFTNLDVRLTRAFSIGEQGRLEVLAEVFNVGRNSNRNFGNDAISVYGDGPEPAPNFGVPLFAPSTARFGGPRQLQLGMRLTF